MQEALGANIKQLRKRKKLTLKQISQQTGLSISFLSQLENGKSSATLESLKKISDTLGVNPSHFFDEPEKDPEEAIARNTSDVDDLGENTFIYRDLTGKMQNPLFTPILVVLNPGDNQGNNITHSGQEFLYVLEGTLTVMINQTEYTLEPYDSIFVDSSKPHYWLNRTEETVKFLCVSAEG
ncbi:helix-turn-helix domain-containing protein [Virgibacillus xinjiangensis]|uniref:Helix-turn-helix domain-containing protein n=1 Tax=Virgibacillus xinjiangensis TaxID=393090 RepID=A0ABV7CTM7_9BACI